MQCSLLAFAALAAVPLSVLAEPSVGILGNADKIAVDGHSTSRAGQRRTGTAISFDSPVR